MFRVLSLLAVLIATWLLLSGHYEPLLLVLGALSCLLGVAIARRMDIVDHEGHPIHLSWRAPFYWIWLAWQILLANLDVARRILSPNLPINPRVITVTAKETTELGQVIFANSITLTPGTVSMRLQSGEIEVHALTQSAAEDLLSGKMDRRVAKVEDIRDTE